MLKLLSCKVIFLMLALQSMPFFAVSSTYIFWTVNRFLDVSVDFKIRGDILSYSGPPLNCQRS